MARPFKVFEHGTIGMYRQRKCRCDLCKMAVAEQRAAYRPKPGDQPTNYKVRYGSVRVRLCPEPLIQYLEQVTLVNNQMRKVFADWRKNGIDLYRADEMAIQYGTHPYLLWGDEFYQQIPGVSE